MANEPLTVGQAAKRTGLTPRAVRLYEARGLLLPVARTEVGYRVYSEHDIQLLRFIGQSRALGLRLMEIREIINLRRNGTPPSDEVLALLERRVDDIDERVSSLRSLRRSLGEVLETVRTSVRRGEDVRLCRLVGKEDAASGVKHAARGGVPARARR